MEFPRQSKIPIQQIIQYLTQLMTPGRSVLVGIDGGAGSGKTTFSHWLAEKLKETIIPISVIHTDNFYFPSAERENSQFPLATVSDIDWTRLRDQVLVPLRSGAPARFQLYDWPADCLKDWMTIDVGGIVIIEGVSVTRNELSDYYDLRVWFSCPRDIRISRLLRRGDTSAAEIEHWMPSEDDYIAFRSPEGTAHLIVDSTAEMTTLDGNGWYATRWSPPGIT